MTITLSACSAATPRSWVINMIDVPKKLQGRGIGKKLLRHLHKEYRPKEVNYGYSTPAGSKLIKSYKKKYPDG